MMKYVKEIPIPWRLRAPIDAGALAAPTPKSKRPSDEARAGFSFLSNLDANKEAIAASKPKNHDLAVRMPAELSDGRLNGIGLY